MKYCIRKFTVFHIFCIIFLTGFGLFAGLYAFSPVTGVLFVLAGLGYAWYLSAWKLEFNTDTGEFHCRTLFYSQEFHVSDIKSYGNIVYTKFPNVQFRLTVSTDGIEQNIYMPEANTKELKQYLERRERRPWRYEK
ncbi:MAG: hypothetical protein IJ642_07840 [Oscillospiraceae bacterium]|nr:hypothetical protein [Oscillospiraceae bacterium]